MKHNLKVDWATHKAAKHACENWHYSKSLPVGKLVKIGVWEDSKYIGCVLFSRGANRNMPVRYNLTQRECVELTRVALDRHKTMVTRIVSIAIKYLKNSNTGIRLIVSYADTGEGHIGLIYQAGNWIFNGTSLHRSIELNNKTIHKKTLHSKYGSSSVKKLKKLGLNIKTVEGMGKHRYLMPLDKEMRKQILPLSQPYPKRVKQAIVDIPINSGGATPTDTLQTNDGA